MRDFDTWLNSFRESIADYGYYVDFDKVHRNVEEIRVELCILNSLIGSADIENDFAKILAQYPQTLKCIPILIAVRQNEIHVMDSDVQHLYSFARLNQSIEQYSIFMRKTGLFDLLERRIVSSLLDYVTGVETGLDSNGRKNRGGHLMENVVSGFIERAGVTDFEQEMKLSKIQKRWGIKISGVLEYGVADKRFDFAVYANGVVYCVETNFYTGGGSKLNETARSYKTLSKQIGDVDGLKFVWVTDGIGWKSAKNNLRETFEAMEHIYSIDDLQKGAFERLFK
ncbi:MAG: type II restriction endonuclease [Phycisphaerae bacterium]